jgi:protein N-terminal amidase
VAFGYIEQVGEGTSTKLYNSAAVLNRSGEIIVNYRKNHLYYNDRFWAEEGKGFVNFQLITVEGKYLECVVGICMDINPKDFTSGKYELADHVVKTKADVLVFISNWVDSEKD